MTYPLPLGPESVHRADTGGVASLQADDLRSRMDLAQIWGGLAWSAVRVGGHLRDQFRETGHHDRLADLEAVAGLGLRTLRYPVSWERVAPDAPAACDWAWHDQRLAELRRLGVAPILGLVHHGG